MGASPATPRRTQSWLRSRRAAASRAAAEPSTTSLHQWLNVIVLLGIVTVNLLQRPGLTTFDTKLDLTEDPTCFMSRSLSVWNPDIMMGSLQNQAYGYLFPVAPFFAIGEAVGAPMWLWQRLWSALLMVVAYLGMKRLARQIAPIGPGAAVLAGLSYAMAPRILMTVGVLTGESLPAAVLPWAVLPLACAWRGRIPWARAVLLSAAALPFMSGLNATEVICTLPLPFLLIACAPLPGRRRLRLVAGWTALVGVVCLWWIGPLLILGRYASPFLNYIESAAVTTAPMDFTTVLRGNSHWLAFLPVAESHWDTGRALTYSPLLVALSAAVGILGLIGLALSRAPQRRPLLLAALLGLVVMALGHGGWGGSPLAGAFRDFLDGAGAPFRNIHKLDPIVRVGVSVGLALLVTRARSALSERSRGQSLVPPAVARRVPMAVVTTLVVLLGLPAFQGDLRAADGWTQIPQPWRQTEQRLRSLPENSRVLVLPGSGFADQDWGRTVDEVAQTMPGVSWATRSQVPLIGPGGIRLLDSVEQQIGDGRPVPGLSSMLANAGFTHVLVRDDLVRDAGANRPTRARVAATLDLSGGFTAEPGLGRPEGGDPMLQLFSIDDASTGTRVRAVPVSGVRRLQGESDQLIALRESRVLGPTELTSPSVGSAPILTEGAERRDRNFGRVHDATTSVKTQHEPWETSRAAHDYDSVATRRLTTSDYGAVQRVTASTTADSVTGFGPVRRDVGPWAAFDGASNTEFRTGVLTRPRGQWVQADLTAPRAVGRITVTTGTPVGAVTAVRVTTDAGSRVVRVGQDGTATTPDLGGRTSFVRVTVEAVRDEAVSQVGITDVRLSELRPRRTENVATSADARTTLAFRTWSGRSECVSVQRMVECEPLIATGAEEAAGLARRVQITERGQWVARGTVRVASADLADSLLRPPGKGIVVRASSTYNDQPLAVPMRAVDGNDRTGWTSANQDRTPWLDLSWQQTRKITGFALAGVRRSGPGVEPAVASVTVDGRPVWFRKDGDRYVFNRSVEGRSMRVNLSSPLGLPMTVSEVTVPGLSDLVYRPRAADRTSLPCGFGPDITAGGRTVPTRITGTIGDLTSGAPMSVVACGGPLELEPGRYRFALTPAAGLVPSTLTFAPAGQAASAAQDLPLRTTSWGDERRSVRVGGSGEAVLVVPENMNDGWVATVGDRALRPVLIDGWKQGFVVPAGTERTVELRYRPATAYRAVLLAGAVGVLGVWLWCAGLLLAGAGGGRARLPRRAGLETVRRRLGSTRAAGAHRAVGRPALRRLGITIGRRRGRRTVALSSALVLTLLAGLAPGLGVILGLCLRRWTAAVVTVTVVATIGAALVWSLYPSADGVRLTADLVSGLGLGVVVGVALGRGPASRRGETDE